MTARKPPAPRAAARKPPAKRSAPARGKATPAGAKRAPARGKPAPSRAKAAPRSARKVVGRATKGDRPYVVGMFVLVLVLLSMAWSPLRSLAAGDQRLEELTASRDRLAEEVQRLEQRQDELMDPQELELIAREELGLVKPGEIPYVVVTPERDPQLGPVDDAGDLPEVPWYRRLWSAIRRFWQ